MYQVRKSGICSLNLELYLNPTTQIRRHIEVFVFIIVAIGLFKITTLGINFIESKFILILTLRLSPARQFGQMHLLN